MEILWVTIALAVFVLAAYLIFAEAKRRKANLRELLECVAIVAHCPKCDGDNLTLDDSETFWCDQCHRGFTIYDLDNARFRN